MISFLTNLLTASVHGSIVILAVLALRLVLCRAPKKYICMLWLLAGFRLLLPIELRSELSIQPGSIPAEEAVAAVMNWTKLVPWIWGGIAGCFAIYSLMSYLKLKRRVRDAVRIRGGWESDRIETAFILGFIRPQIYIPTGMDRRERKYILEHERTHLDKGDHWIKMIGFVALALHWFNPLVWIAYLCLCRDIEMACDERVVQFMELEERKGYSSALLSCSASRVHFASPVAFGEISVKQRILSVLNYRKPAFWISLLAVLAIGFVAVCLLTSPVEPAPAVPEVTVPTTPEGETGYAAGLKQSEIAYVCEQAMEELLSRETFFIRNEQTVTRYGEQSGTEQYVTENRRHGNNVLNAIVEDEVGENLGGTLIYNGEYALFMGDAWCWQTPGGDTGLEWLEAYSPKGNVVTFPEGTGILSGDTVALHMEWTDKLPWERTHSGIVTYTFDEAGNLTNIHRNYTDVHEDGEKTEYTHSLTILEEAPEETARHIEELASVVMTPEELEAERRDAERVTEIPSNKTSYDLDFALGAGSKQWTFLNESWHVRIAGENPTAEGMDLVFSESGDNHTAFAAEERWWLEKLEGKTWVLVGDFASADTRNITVSWTGTDRIHMDWSDTFGSLEGGYYRLGRDYTVTLSTGETETAPCYAKFRLYDAGQDALLDKCRKAVEDLIASDSYHILSTSYRVEIQRHEEEPRYATQEVWKSGKDYLMEHKTYYVDQSKGLWGHSGGMWRDGRTYDLTWEGEDMSTPVARWTMNTYMDELNFTLWEMDYTWYDSRVEGVVAQGNRISILETYDYNNDFELIETQLTFSDTGKLTGIRTAFLPTRYCAEDDKLVDAIAVIFDTEPEEISRTIHSQDLSGVGSFSWEEEQGLYEPGLDAVRTKNFHNVNPVQLDTPEAVIDHALKDCTLPASGGLEPGCNVMEVFRDPESGMWKVSFTASWDDRICQDVYLDSQGITRMTVTLELEVEY